MGREFRTEVLKQYRLDYSKGYYVRELGKLLGTSHVTILPHLQSLEKEGILVSQIVGKNKEYRLNHKNFLVKDFLCTVERKFSYDFFSKNKKFLSFYEKLCDLQLTSSIFFSEDFSQAIVVGENDDKEEKIKNLAKDLNLKTSFSFFGSEEFYHKILTHDLEVKKLLKNRLILNNVDFVVNLLWRNFINVKRGDDLE